MMAVATKFSARLKLRSELDSFSRWRTRYRSMPLGSALRYTWHWILRRKSPVRVFVYGVPIWIRPRTPDLKVASESLGDELDVPISYYDSEFDGVIIDAGGYIGSAAIRFARSFPKAKIISIEPSKTNFQVLKDNTCEYNNIYIVNAALASGNGITQLKDRGSGEWGHTTVQCPADSKNEKILEEVQNIEFRQLQEMFHFKNVGILKMDIEGSEFDLLQVSHNWLPNSEILVAELHEHIVPGVTELFKTKTYSGRANLALPGEKIISIRR